ncbi:hypothetical protein P8625_09700 [Tenacibaculum tangerinum]|uniref:Lipoprotein n=1 Tax=Tenacibaculum tangerinum TaxID=3038772 RepID=A0ABY8L2Q4_9FLAO|nr:hypothetical protein [Tenacibaculum tangerinum]WGH74385.1 hypothetical protein P8625_09700 [Tenacibaculum tangerinum]
MTLKFVKESIYILSLLSFLVVTSCQSDETEKVSNSELTTEEALEAVLENDISSGIESVIEDDVVLEELSVKGTVAKNNHPECLTRTIEETAGSKKVTLDFGTACTGKKGHVFAGKISIEYTRVEGGFLKTVTFENFSVDGNAVVGTIVVSKVRENIDGHPERTYSIDLSITLKTGETITKKGEKIKEMIEGYDTHDRGDDVFLISGFWKSVNKAGKEVNVTITTDLRREYACKYIVSGVVEVTRGERSYTIDFGDGSCDSNATITDAAGNTKEIILKDRY